MYCMPKTLPYSRPSPRTIPLGDYTHILAFGVEEGSLVGRGHIFNWRKNYKGESDEEERGANIPDVYPAPVSPRVYNTC
jgi:hypothetical protein